MEKGMNRREFLKATATTGAVLMGGNLLRQTAMAQGAVNIPEAEKIVITMVTDNYYDVNRLDYKIAKRHTFISNPLEAAVHAEHGLAYQIETVVNGESHTCLFDFGSDPRGVLKNMDLLKIDCKKVEALGLSHDHWDHETALVEILKAKKEEFSKNIPLYLGAEFFVGTYSKRPNGNISQLNLLKKEAVEELEKTLSGGSDRSLIRDFVAARLRYTAGRYDAEARLNQAIGELYELQVRKSNIDADRHHLRSQRFFYGMLGAQMAVIISTFALAARKRNLLWSLAAAAGAAAVGFAAYVYISM